MKVARMWYALVKIDTVRVLEMSAPLAVVTEALGRTLSSVDSVLYESTLLEIELRPL